jgi:guanylate kinase
MRLGNLLVVSAPSGSGKTTLVKRLLLGLDGVVFSISYTTRERRPAEQDGVDYHFIPEETFREKIARGDFLEWAEVHGRLYGTDRLATEEVRRRGLDILLDVDVQGAASVKSKQPEAVLIFILPPSFEVLEARLRGRRQNEEEAEIQRRLWNARREVIHYQSYDYILVNEEISRSADLLRAIVLAERARVSRLEAVVQPILESFREGG